MERALIPARRRWWTTSARQIFGPGSPDRRQGRELTGAVARRERAAWLGRQQGSPVAAETPARVVWNYSMSSWGASTLTAASPRLGPVSACTLRPSEGAEMEGGGTI